MADVSEHQVKVSVLRQDVYGSFTGAGDYGDDKITDVLAWLQSCLDAIPEEFRDSAKLDIESVGGYEGEHHTEIEIYYSRPETDDERENREALVRWNKKTIEDRERATLAALRTKYGE